LQRLRASDLLQATANNKDFPVIIETYRECLQDVFDLAALKKIIGDIESGRIGYKFVKSIIFRRPRVHWPTSCWKPALKKTANDWFCGRQRSEDRGQRTEGRQQRTEDGKLRRWEDSEFGIGNAEFRKKT
jgi:hypothetical protein